MTILLPYTDSRKTALCLSDLDLRHQTESCLRVLKALVNPEYKHPLSDTDHVWKYYEVALVYHTHTLLDRFAMRSTGTSNLAVEYLEGLQSIKNIISESGVQIVKTYPVWYGYQPLHYSHRAMLIRSNERYYGGQWPKIPAHKIPLFNPTKYEFHIVKQVEHNGMGTKQRHVRVRLRSQQNKAMSVSACGVSNRCARSVCERGCLRKVQTWDEHVQRVNEGD